MVPANRVSSHSTALDRISLRLECFGSQPRMFLAFSALATSVGESPGRLSSNNMFAFMFMMVSRARIISRTEYPVPVPRLNVSDRFSCSRNLSASK